MNKSNLINKVAEVTDLPYSKAEKAVNGMLEAMQGALKSGDKVTLVGFGSFSTYKRPPRRGRNPKTGEAINIEAKKVVKFKAGTRLASEIK